MAYKKLPGIYRKEDSPVKQMVGTDQEDIVSKLEKEIEDKSISRDMRLWQLERERKAARDALDRKHGRGKYERTSNIPKNRKTK